jgi:hypothetical protein
MLSLRFFALGAVGALAFTVLAGVATTSEAQSGSLEVQIVKGGLFVGAGGGSGTMLYKGRRYPFSVSGLSVGGTIGASRAKLAGLIYNLRQPSDLAGTYSALGAGATVGAGGGTVRLESSNGVIIELRGRTVGLELSANVSRVEITMR